MAMDNDELKKTLRKNLDDAKLTLETIIKEIAKAKSIGMDVRALQKEHDTLMSQIVMIEKVYSL